MVECPGGEFEVGTQVMAMMGGMGRQFDGGYAELTCVPVRQVIPSTSTLPWPVLGAVPEMLQTAYGSPGQCRQAARDRRRPCRDPDADGLPAAVEAPAAEVRSHEVLAVGHLAARHWVQ